MSCFKLIPNTYFQYAPRDHHFCQMSVGYKEPLFIASTRSELFDFTEFIGCCGGLLSLFIGFSVLSFVELIYFVTLRLFCTLRKEEKDEQSNNVVITRQNELNWLTFLIKQIYIYVENSNLHGVNYIGDQTRHWVER